MDENRLQRAVDQSEILELVKNWAYARDNGDWEVLASCYQPDATMHISWISDTAAAFIEGSKTMLAKTASHEPGKHNIGSTRIRINGNRAAGEVHAELLRRLRRDGVDFDTQTWGRFLDLYEKREDGVWRIFKRTMVYEKDRLDPVDPSQLPQRFWENIDLDRFPPECRFLCYRLSLIGQDVRDNIIPVHSDAEKAVLAEQDAWIA